MEKLPNEDLIDFYYENAVRNIEDSWFEVTSTEWYDYVIGLSDKEKITYMIGVLDEEVSNGGFNQYFVNGYGQFAKETIEALNFIEALYTASLLKDVFLAVNKDKLTDEIFRRELLLGNIDILYEDDELDDYLYNLSKLYYEDKDNLGQRLEDYLRDK